VTREAEYSLHDWAMLTAQAEWEADLGPHGQPMSEATNALADPMLRGQGWLYEPFRSEDYASQAIVRAQKALEKAAPDDKNLDRFLWGVRKVMKPPIPPGGG
jgi:hypothetical protein